MKSIKKLQLAQNSAARIIDRTPRRAHMTPVLRDLHWLPKILTRFRNGHFYCVKNHYKLTFYNRLA